MKTYKITLTSDKSELAVIDAENAIAALNAYCAERPNEDIGFQRGGLNIDADTRGQKWATVKTDGGRISADLLTAQENLEKEIAILTEEIVHLKNGGDPEKLDDCLAEFFGRELDPKKLLDQKRDNLIGAQYNLIKMLKGEI